MPLSTARIIRLSLACLAVCFIAGSPLASVGLVVAQVITPYIVATIIAVVFLAVYLLEGRQTSLPLTLVASRTFILGCWLLSLAMLWLVTLAVTPQAFETATAACNVALFVGMLAYRQCKAGRFWPSATDGRQASIVGKLKAMFAQVDELAS